MPPLPSPSFDPTPWLIGLAALITAIGTVLAQYNKAVARTSRRYRAAFRQLQRRYDLALLHIYTLERGYAVRGVVAPPRPQELDEVSIDDGQDIITRRREE